MTHLTRRAALALVPAALALTACGSGGSGGEQPSAATGSASSGAAFPVTIKHALGTATIEAKPKRVVTLGQGSAETSIALGTIPVGTERTDWGADPKTHYLPWVEQGVKAKGGKAPELITGGTELDVEKVVELEPDLILAPWSGLTKEQYAQLSKVAPTVAYAKAPWTVQWDEQIRTIGTALGERTAADQQITDLKAQLKKGGVESHPAWQGKSFVYAYNTGPGTLGVFGADEQRVAYLTQMGLSPDPAAAALVKPGAMSTDIGLEQASKLSGADLFFTFYMDAAAKKAVEAQPLYAAIPAVKQGAVVSSTDTSLVTASSMINPLSVPYSLGRYGQLIDAAVAKAK